MAFANKSSQPSQLTKTEKDHQNFLESYRDSASFDCLKISVDRVAIFNCQNRPELVEIRRLKSSYTHQPEFLLSTDFYRNWVMGFFNHL